MNAKGIGQSVLRKEDGRFMAGRGSYVGDIKPSRLMEVAFARSAIAHGRIRAIEKPDGAENRVFTASDLDGVKPIRAPSKLPGYKASDFPSLAVGKVRFVGEPLAACIGETRAEAEDRRDPRRGGGSGASRHGRHRAARTRDRHARGARAGFAVGS